jgi:hypothetical protein
VNLGGGSVGVRDDNQRVDLKVSELAVNVDGVEAWAVARSPAALGSPALASADGKVSIDAGPPMEFPKSKK